MRLCHNNVTFVCECFYRSCLTIRFRLEEKFIVTKLWHYTIMSKGRDLLMSILYWYYWLYMARPKGLEPLTYWLEVSCSIQLSYGRCGKKRVYWTNSSYHQSQLYQASPYGCHILFSCNNHRVVSIQALPRCLYSCLRFSFSLKPKKWSFWSTSL